MGSNCPDCSTEMDKITGVDSDRMKYICPQCADDWLYEMSMTRYDEPAEIPFH